jgi:hypothetical protein
VRIITWGSSAPYSFCVYCVSWSGSKLWPKKIFSFWHCFKLQITLFLSTLLLFNNLRSNVLKG